MDWDKSTNTLQFALPGWGVYRHPVTVKPRVLCANKMFTWSPRPP